MRAALAYELTRIRTIRSTWWITALAVVIGVLISGLFSFALDNETNDRAGPFPSIDELGAAIVTQLAATGEVPSFVSFVLAIIGILAWGHEYRHGMVRTSLTTVRSRTALWVAKYVVVVAWVAVSAFVTMVLAGLVSMFFVGDWLTVFSGLTWGIIGRQVLYAVLLALVAMGFTAITRSQVLAIVMLFLWPLMVEPIVQLFFVLVPSLRDDQGALRFLPFGAGRRMVALLDPADSTFGDPLSALGGALVFGLLAAAFAAASYVLFVRRDA